MEFDTKWNEKQKLALSILLNQTNWIKEVWYGWGAGWWKSYGGVFWWWLLCNSYSWITFFFGRKELKRLKQSTLATYFKFLWDYNIPVSQQWKLNNQDSVIYFNNGSKIILLDLANQPSDPLFLRFWSLELTAGFIDESNEVSYSCIDILKTRVWRQKNKEYWILPRIFETFNPDKGHVYRRFYKPYKNNTLKDNITFIPALATDNKYLDESYIDSLRNADPITRERLLLWNFEYDDTPWRIFDYDAILWIWTNPKLNGVKYISADIARKWKDLAIILVWDDLEVIEAVIYPTSTNEVLQDKIRELSRKHIIWMRNVVVDEDWVGGWVVDNLRCQWFINNSRQIEDKHKKLNYQNLKTQCYFKLAEYVNNSKISISCINWDNKTKLIEELDIVVEKDLDKDSKKRIISKEEIKEKLWRSPDFSDALMMRMYYELKQKLLQFN